MKSIVIIGCGLIGGSFAALAKEQRINVHGIGRREEPLKVAQENGLLTTYSTIISKDIIDTADAVFIASPISTVIPIIKDLNHLTNKPMTIVEFSSVKSFLKDPTVINSHHEIIAAHPMGGSDVQGLENASAEILRNRPMITFNGNTKLNTFFESLSFNLIHCDSYEEHDEWMSYISHGPYLVASLMPLLLSNKSNDYLEKLSKVAAGGFRDTTRVSNSPVEWGLDIMLGNKDVLLNRIDDLTASLSTLKSTLTTNDKDTLEKLLSNAKNTRKSIIKD